MSYRINNLEYALDVDFADLAAFFRRAIRKRTTTFMVIGKTGAGKSESTASLCMEIDPSFGVDNMVWDMNSFYEKGEKLINSGKDLSVMIADDFGSEADAYDFIAESQKNLNHLLEKGRPFHMGLFITVPHPKFISKNIRDRISDYEIILLGHNADLGLAKAQIKKKRVRFDKEEPIKTHLYTYLDGGVFSNYKDGMLKVRTWYIPRPPPSFTDWYVEFRKQLAFTQFNKSKGEHDKAQVAKKIGTKEQIKEDADSVMVEENTFIKLWRGKRIIDVELLKARKGYSDKYARIIKADIQDRYLKDD
jgi:hypothetical protein